MRINNNILLKKTLNKKTTHNITIGSFYDVYQIKEVICSYVYEPIERTSGLNMATLGKQNQGSDDFDYFGLER